MTCNQQIRRNGAHSVEAAFIYPLVLLFVIGTIIGGIAVFRNNQVANLAREGARWASVHGATYSADTGDPKATEASVWESAILPKMVGMDRSRVTYSVTWDDPYQDPKWYDYDAGAWKTNYVHVTVTYQWMPEAFLVGPINIRGTSDAAVSY